MKLRCFSQCKVIEEIKYLNPKKATQSKNVPAKTNYYPPFTGNDFNNCLEQGTFPEQLKIAEVTPTYKRDNPYDKTNYRSISLLLNISKLNETRMHNEMYEYFNHILPKFQCGFRKDHGAQHKLLFMIEEIRKIRDNTQLAFICSKLTIETLEQGVKHV